MDAVLFRASVARTVLLWRTVVTFVMERELSSGPTCSHLVVLGDQQVGLQLGVVTPPHPLFHLLVLYRHLTLKSWFSFECRF